jgi:site-specific recombinase XerD
MNNNRVVDAWLDWSQASSRHSVATTYQYRSIYVQLLDHLGATPLSGVTVEALEQFTRRPRRSGEAPSDATIRKETAAMRSLWKWMIQRGMVAQATPDLLDTPRVDNIRPKPVEAAEWQWLWRQPLSDEERVAYGLSMFTSLRREEVCRLTAPQFVSHPSRRIQGMWRKGGRTADHPWFFWTCFFAEKRSDLLPDPHLLFAALNRLREAARVPSVPLLAGWVSRGTSHIDVGRYNKQLHSRLRIHPHQLRHAFCTNALEAGAPLEQVSRAAGHADINTTMRYVRTLEEPWGALGVTALNPDEGEGLDIEPRKVTRWGR